MEAYICDGVRTPIGRYGGALSSIRTDDLAALPITALMERNPSVDWSAVDDVILRSANQAGEDNRNVTRMAALLAGLPQDVPGTTVTRLCASGMDAVGFAARGIKAGDYDLTIAGGVESMSRAPFVMPKATSAFTRANTVHDTTIGWRFVNPKSMTPSAQTACHKPPITSPPSITSLAPTKTPSPPGPNPVGTRHIKQATSPPSLPQSLSPAQR